MTPRYNPSKDIATPRNAPPAHGEKNQSLSSGGVEQMTMRVCVDYKRITPKRAALPSLRGGPQQGSQRGSSYLHSPAYRRQRAAFLAAWVKARGHWCPGHATTGRTGPTG